MTSLASTFFTSSPSGESALVNEVSTDNDALKESFPQTLTEDCVSSDTGATTNSVTMERSSNGPVCTCDIEVKSSDLSNGHCEVCFLPLEKDVTTQEQRVLESMMESDVTCKDDDDEEYVGKIDMKNVKDIDLGPVSTLSDVLSGYTYDEIRASLHHKYGLIVKDEPSFEKLYMITYQKRERTFRPDGQEDQKPLSDEQQKIVDQYRGVIVEKDTNVPLCYTFDRMARHLADDCNLKDYEVTETCDGSQIKIFFYETGNFWVVSTTRRIDASRTYFFSEKSFLDMFQDGATHLDWNRLNKECCYSFVLSHPENRVVTRHDRPGLTHVLTRNMKTFEIVEDDDIGMDRPHKLVFQQKRDIWNAVKRLPYYKEGFVVRKGGEFVKIINKKYQEVKNLRGNSSSLLTHFFHLRKKNKINQFLKYYPEFRDTFAAFEDSFYNLCCHAYNEYVLLRVRKVIDISQVLPFLKPVLYRVHGVHIQRHIRITLGDVQRHLEQYSPYNLRRLVDMANGLPFAFL